MSKTPQPTIQLCTRCARPLVNSGGEVLEITYTINGAPACHGCWDEFMVTGDQKPLGAVLTKYRKRGAPLLPGRREK